jgi:hypothetical protein
MAFIRVAKGWNQVQPQGICWKFDKGAAGPGGKKEGRRQANEIV